MMQDENASPVDLSQAIGMAEAAQRVRGRGGKMGVSPDTGSIGDLMTAELDAKKLMQSISPCGASCVRTTKTRLRHLARLVDLLKVMMACMNNLVLAPDQFYPLVVDCQQCIMCFAEMSLEVEKYIAFLRLRQAKDCHVIRIKSLTP